MKVIKEEFDSVAFGKNVLKFDDVDIGVDFADFERKYVQEYNPAYVYVKIPVEEIDKIHYLEQNGFEFIECQLQLFRRLTGTYDTSPFGGELKVELAKNGDLDEICRVSDQTFDIDRIYIDTKLDRSIAQKRYHLYLKNSFEQENQRLDKLVDVHTGRIIGFHSLLYKDPQSVLLLLGGVHPDYHKSGANYALDYYVYNELYRLGYKNITTHISARNLKVMNYLIKVLNFKVKQSFVVLRKLY